MRYQLINLSILLCLLPLGCKSQPKKIEKKAEDTNSTEKGTIEKLYNPTLSVIADDYTLKDSTTFYELVNFIIENAEINTTNQHELTDGYISYNVYKLVYETSDDQISLNRKLDLLSLMFFYHYHTANEYNSKVSGEIRRGNEKVLSRPVLLIPVLNATYWSESVLYTITQEETIILPKSYVPTMNKTLVEINELLNFRKANKQTFYGPMNHLFDKQFSYRYPQHHR
ncbi:hypothetical protein [Fluviicola sp.]|uniref:hypothetical protein n=1 Tax=Fluviicola sp. TaxID=1917219 RepID=UPI003D278F6B